MYTPWPESMTHHLKAFSLPYLMAFNVAPWRCSQLTINTTMFTAKLHCNLCRHQVYPVDEYMLSLQMLEIDCITMWATATKADLNIALTAMTHFLRTHYRKSLPRHLVGHQQNSIRYLTFVRSTVYHTRHIYDQRTSLYTTSRLHINYSEDLWLNNARDTCVCLQPIQQP